MLSVFSQRDRLYLEQYETYETTSSYDLPPLLYCHKNAIGYNFLTKLLVYSLLLGIRHYSRMFVAYALLSDKGS